MIYHMDRTDILRALMPERTKQIALAWSILRQSHLSEDAYQDMLTRVFENESTFEGPQHVRDWMTRQLSWFGRWVRGDDDLGTNTVNSNSKL